MGVGVVMPRCSSRAERRAGTPRSVNDKGSHLARVSRRMKETAPEGQSGRAGARQETASATLESTGSAALPTIRRSGRPVVEPVVAPSAELQVLVVVLPR